MSASTSSARPEYSPAAGSPSAGSGSVPAGSVPAGSFTISPRGPFSLAEAAAFGFGQRDGRDADGVMRLAFCVDGYTEQVGVEVRQDAAGQIAELLRDWTLPGSDDELRAWLAGWQSDGGDARRFRRASAARFGPDRWAAERAAWRYSQHLLTPLRLVIREVARALLVHPRPLPRDVVAAIAGPVQVTAGMSDPSATMGPST